MAAPLSGIGQQQVLSQPFQPGGDDQARTVRQQDQEARSSGDIQARGAPAAEARSSDTANEDRLTKKLESETSVVNDNSASQRRGSVVNIVV